MKSLLTKSELIAFEEDIANCFRNKKILSPIHLSDGNEDQLIDIFKDVQEEDHILCSWRSHYHALLKGVSPKKLKAAILDNRSISLCFKKQKMVSSAIVSGPLSIGVGLAMDIKRKGQASRVWVFSGDMTSTSGQFYEAFNYVKYHNLPAIFVVEDNGFSVCTNTRSVWNTWKLPFEPMEFAQGTLKPNEVYKSEYLWYYRYKLEKWSHAGLSKGERIQF